MTEVVTVILKNDEGKILILKRSSKVKTYKGMWGGVAGYIEKDENPYETALKEIKEEVGLEQEDVELLKEFDPVSFTDFYEKVRYDWKVFPFLFKVREKRKIKIDWEHSEYRWIAPSQILEFDTVPHFKEIVSKMF
ncbi:MAG: NUDIX pyrophosphatase [Candidatus Thermoplasmatota archaeon]|jgi:8-oxo-dGTP pyrophosphatase MutT (NUDIX family)|nr:NUDIX pyrophosphatase [Candidatus Thermoplasmatota archaeon]